MYVFAVMSHFYNSFQTIINVLYAQNLLIKYNILGFQRREQKVQVCLHQKHKDLQRGGQRKHC